jgi:DNA-binding beta-propeller fold protein YncE
MNEPWLISNYSEPRNIAFDENYTYAYVANFNGGSITQIKLAEDITLPPISVNPTFITGLLLPSCVVFDKNYKYLYVVNRGTNTIIQVTIDKNNPENTPVINSEWINKELNAPCYMAFDSSNTYAYVVNVGNNTKEPVNNYISQFKFDAFDINMRPHLINAKWYVSEEQDNPNKILFDPTYQYLYVTNNGNPFSSPPVLGYITQFTLDENPEKPAIKINNEWVKDIFCQFLIFDNTNTYAYLTDNNNNVIQIKLDIENNPTNLNFDWANTKEGPCDMAFDVTYKNLYVCNNNNFTISVITLSDNPEENPRINLNWSIGGLIIPSGIVFDNKNIYAYASNLNSGTISQILLNKDDPIVINSTFVTNLKSPNDIAYDNINNCLYVINNGVRNGTISKIFLNNDKPLEPPNVILDWADVQSNPWCIIIDNNNTYAYVSNVNSNTISRIYLKSEPHIVENNWITDLNGPTGMSFDNNNKYLYVTMINDNTITLITLSDNPDYPPDIKREWFTGFNTPDNNSGLAYIVVDDSNTCAYVGNYYTNIISQMLLNEPSITNLNFINDSIDGLEGLNIHNNYLYLSNAYNSSITRCPVRDPPIGCFLNGSKVLTKDGLINIQLLKKGDLVQTLNHGLLPIKYVGKSSMFNKLTEERINPHVYKLNKNNFPELSEDLFITGGHPLLVDEKDLDEETKKKLLDMDNISIITEGKYRVFAMLHPKSELWNEEGYHEIYDIVLENENPHMNYGIWVNGILTESMDEDFFLKYSKMTEINK